MKYVIMCGGRYEGWERPRQLSVVKGEMLVERTIRLLRENGIVDIAISSNHEAFEQFGVPVLKHSNNFAVQLSGLEGYWVNAFIPVDGPVCYLFGDVVYSEAAIKKIVEAKTDDVEFFASSPPFSEKYCKRWAEPFAFKVANQCHFRNAIDRVVELHKLHKFNRHPIAWELWQVIKGTPINVIDYHNYIAINDYTCDVDAPEDAEMIERMMG